jgi:hypothetical protein
LHDDRHSDTNSQSLESPGSKSLDPRMMDLDSPVTKYEGDLYLEHVRHTEDRTKEDAYQGSMRSPRQQALGAGSSRMKRTGSYMTRADRSSCNSPPPSHSGLEPRGSMSFNGPLLSKAAQHALTAQHAHDAKFVEKNVGEDNFLCESHFYRGFFYMMKNAEHEMAASQRDELFPALSLSLESVLHDIVREQLEREMKQKKASQAFMGHQGHGGHGVHDSNSGTIGRQPHKSHQQHPTYPTGPIRNPAGAHPIILLAQELKKRSKTYQREHPPITPPAPALDPASLSTSMALFSGEMSENGSVTGSCVDSPRLEISSKDGSPAPPVG